VAQPVGGEPGQIEFAADPAQQPRQELRVVGTAGLFGEHVVAFFVDLGLELLLGLQPALLSQHVDEVLLAHEYLDEAGDGARAEMAKEQEDTLQKVRVFYTGNLNVEIAGSIRPSSYEVSDKATRRFFVMRKPEVRGMKLEGDRDLELLNGLDYAILNKTRLSYIYDFNE